MIDRWWGDIRKAVWEDNRKELARKRRPPEDAIVINRPDGTPYMHVWSDVTANRVCMMFSNIPGVVTKWSAVTLPNLIPALVRVQQDFSSSAPVSDAGKSAVAGNTQPTLTAEEREAVEFAYSRLTADTHYASVAATLRGLLERLNK